VALQSVRSKADAPFTRGEYARRVAGVERALDEAGLDALIAYSAGHQPGPVAYVAGYEPRFGLHDVAFFVLVPGQAYTLLSNAFWDDPASLTWTDDVRVTSAFGPALADLLPGEVRRLGIAGLGFFPAPVFLALPAVEVVDATPLLKRVAQIKSPCRTGGRAALRRDE
jgi:Xaa-Pro aminopeptidase